LTDKQQEAIRQHYLEQGLVIPDTFKFPVCDHPIEKWCSNCDYDCETYERIPHTRKYPQIYFLDD
tara:strand:- start:718 stop:912 length:195 start_codon:yes stop_codon:yes gene_type:complete